MSTIESEDGSRSTCPTDCHHDHTETERAMTMNPDLGQCQIRGCEATAVVIYSDGGVWCLPCDLELNEASWSGCECCGDIGRWGVPR